MEGGKLCINRGPVCTLENFQWCGEPSFVGAAILIFILEMTFSTATLTISEQLVVTEICKVVL
jgi:hypothetical protein